MPHLDAVVIHCRQPAALAGFYAEVLGLPVAPADAAAIEAGTLGPDESVLLGSRDALHVWLTPVRAIEPVPGRVHLDVRLDVAGRSGPADRPRRDPPMGGSEGPLDRARRPRRKPALRSGPRPCLMHLTGTRRIQQSA